MAATSPKLQLLHVIAALANTALQGALRDKAAQRP